MLLTLTHGGPTIYASDTPATGLAVGTTRGLVWLERDGAQAPWRRTRTALADLHISAALREPRSGTLFVGAYHGSLHASPDGGRTWERRDHGLTQQDVYSMALASHGERTRLYVGSEPAHLFVSEDLGHSWQELPAARGVPGISRWTFPAPPHVAHVKHINFDPRDPSVVYVSIEQGGLLKSTDAGRTFREVAGMDDDVHRTVIHPLDGTRIFITGGDGVYVTQDGGAAWEHRTTNHDEQIGGYPDQLMLVSSRPETMVIAAALHGPGAWMRTGTADSRIHRSDDGGRTWRRLRGGLPDRLDASIEAMCLHDWGASFSLFAATTAGEVFASDDGGEHWGRIASGLGAISKGGHYHLLEPATAGR